MYISFRKLTLIVLTGCTVLASGCAYHDYPPAPPPAPTNASLTRVLDMTDRDGHHYGTVEMDPVGGGKVFDANGRLIGNIVPPIHGNYSGNNNYNNGYNNGN